MAQLSKNLSRTTLKLACAVAAALVVFGVVPGAITSDNSGVVRAAVESPSCWKLTVTPDDAARQAGRAEFIEFIMFDSLGFTAESLAKLGFASSVVEDTGAGAFASTSESESHGVIVWSGTVAGDHISGSCTWTREGVAYVYNFEGARHAVE